MNSVRLVQSRLWLWLILLCVVLGGYWLLPIDGRLIVITKHNTGLVWPQIEMDPAELVPDQSVSVKVSDIKPWSFVRLLVNGQPIESSGPATEQAGVWTWRWTFVASDSATHKLDFYYDCHTGCIHRGEFVFGEAPVETTSLTVPTKLGLVMPNPQRDWRQRSGWAVEVTYAMHAEDPYWGADDLAQRIYRHITAGHRVLVRVDYTQQQSIPPEGDYLALSEYLAYMRRLARDDRLSSVYGFIVGNDYNSVEMSQLNGGQPVTPYWYARVFNGYGEDPLHQDNAVQTIRQENTNVRVLVGPVRPWSFDANGDIPYSIDVPWLNYMNTMVAAIHDAALEKAAAGIPMVGPDGYDIQAPGNPDAPEMAGHLAADEPRIALDRAAWQGAQAGFRIYEDWISIINSYSTSTGLPVYIISTNTYDRSANIPPAQNYPRGWLTNAYDVIAHEPQIVALCWFLDSFPHTDQWDWFSLTEHPGRLVDTADEFDQLLRVLP